MVAQPALDLGEATFEALIGGAQGLFGVHAHMTGQIDAGKQQIADLMDALGLIGVLGQGLATLGEFFLDLVEDGRHFVPIEPDPCGTTLELLGTHQGRQCARDAGQDSVRLPALGARALGSLDLFPADPDGRRIRQFGRAEDMRMAPGQLVADRRDHVGECEMSAFLGHA